MRWITLKVPFFPPLTLKGACSDSFRWRYLYLTCLHVVTWRQKQSEKHSIIFWSRLKQHWKKWLLPLQKRNWLFQGLLVPYAFWFWVVWEMPPGVLKVEKQILKELSLQNDALESPSLRNTWGSVRRLKNEPLAMQFRGEQNVMEKSCGGTE